MADDLGAVRRTPRPTPHLRSTGDRQTPETGPQESAGTTNSPTLVSTDAGNGTDDLSPEVAAALIERHGPEIEALSELGAHILNVTSDLQAYAELPECTACDGSGKDDHGTPFEAPLAVHFAGPPVKAEGRRRQLCMWCGHVLEDVPVNSGDAAWPAWPVGFLVRIDGVRHGFPYDGGELPPGCCALPDDEPRGYGERVCRRCDVQAAFCPCTKPDVACGKHVPGTSSNRCLLRAGHTGDCSDEFEPTHEDPVSWYDRPHAFSKEHLGNMSHVPGGEPCECGRPKRDAIHQPADGPDEAQETRAAADWPAEETS